jgi:hypothetical protein
MIVYGDPQFTESFTDLKARLRSLAATTSLDEVRSLLIIAGELEQGLADLGAESYAHDSAAKRSMVLTDTAAELFLRTLRNERASTADFLRTLEKLEPHQEMLRIKVPEGFAFYSLYPEQYEVTARRWSEDRRSSTRNVLVIGIRSIGTTLSAVVAETLRREGWRARRVTVRPRGHPYSRFVALDTEAIRDSEFAIVVDEGPGRSGSSMAAVARSLIEQGFAPDRVTFFPAHGHEPGSDASAEVRKCWNKTERCVTTLQDLRWNNRSLIQLLAERTSAQFKGEVIATHDLGAGNWRAHVFPVEEDWPAANIPFERSKFLHELADGRRLLWKFEGFSTVARSAEPFPDSLNASRQSENTGIVRFSTVDHFHGFAAFPWIEGRSLYPSDLDSSMVSRLAEYILRSVGPELPHEEARAAVDRLAEMLFFNTRELLGENAVAQTSPLARAARSVAKPGPSYGDGRLQPYEFIRDSQGVVFKTDWYGHDSDHTMVGEQSWLWDVAGLLVEWQPETAFRERLIAQLHVCEPFDDDVLRFYCAAYAAFRAGVTSFSEASASAADQLRIQRAKEFYRLALQHWLNDQPLSRPAQHNIPTLAFQNR